MNPCLRSNFQMQWTLLRGDDEAGSGTGFHKVQNDGATTVPFGENLVNTVADGIHHPGFKIRDGRFLNEDGDANASLSDVATWLTCFYGQAPIVLGDEAANTIDGDERGE